MNDTERRLLGEPWYRIYTEIKPALEAIAANEDLGDERRKLAQTKLAVLEAEHQRRLRRHLAGTTNG
jgi:hypothetical protein